MNPWSLLWAALSFPLIAHVDVARGEHVGEILTEIRIERTVYISKDWCSAAEIGQVYGAQLDKDHTTVQLKVGQNVCRYHVVGTRPFLKHSPTP